MPASATRPSWLIQNIFIIFPSVDPHARLGARGDPSGRNAFYARGVGPRIYSDRHPNQYSFTIFFSFFFSPLNGLQVQGRGASRIYDAYTHYCVVLPLRPSVHFDYTLIFIEYRPWKYSYICIYLVIYSSNKTSTAPYGRIGRLKYAELNMYIICIP